MNHFKVEASNFKELVKECENLYFMESSENFRVRKNKLATLLRRFDKEVVNYGEIMKNIGKKNIKKNKESIMYNSVYSHNRFLSLNNINFIY